jgi:predicted nucleic acid-binding Zn ribbon protein
MKPLRSIVPRAIEDEVLRMAKAQSAMRRWDELVGPALAARSWPDRYERGVVWVAVQGSAWAQELRLRKDAILKGLARLANDESLFSDVRFGVRKLPEVQEKPVEPTPVKLPEKELSIREIAARRLQRWKDENGD